LNQLDSIRKLMGMFVDRIVDEVFSGETGAARLQQLGLFILIFVMEQRETHVTAKMLAARTGQTLSAIYKQLEKLQAVKVVKKTKTLNRQGRGQAFHFSTAQNARTKRLIEALGRSVVRTAGEGRKRR
jgi:predicted transcriptional regulator